MSLSTVNEVAAWFENKTVLLGTVNASVVSKFGLGQFFNNFANTVEISDTHLINASGVLVAK